MLPVFVSAFFQKQLFEMIYMSVVSYQFLKIMVLHNYWLISSPQNFDYSLNYTLHENIQETE